MKKLILLVGFVLFVHNVQSQDLTSNNHTTNLIEIQDNLYKVVVKSEEGSLHQTGFYKRVDKKFVKDGIWKIYDGKNVLTVGEYDNDKLSWITSNGVTYTKSDIQIMKLKHKVLRLQEQLIVAKND